MDGGYLGTLSYQARLMSKSLPSSPEAYGGGVRAWRWRQPRGFPARRASRSDALAKLDLKYKLVGKGLPKNYQGSGEAVAPYTARDVEDRTRQARAPRPPTGRPLAGPDFEQELRETRRQLKTARKRPQRDGGEAAPRDPGAGHRPSRRSVTSASPT